MGDDDAGRTLRTTLERDGVDTSAVLTCDAPSGIAFITVAPDGENMIVVWPGANARVSADDVQRHAALLQLEIPDDAVLAAATLAGGLVVLNPAPARPLSRTLLDHVDICVPNEHELSILTGQPVPSTDDLATLSQRLPVPTVVATLGAAGVLLRHDGELTRVAAPDVEVVDTTAAGDTFCGALAAALVQDASGLEATRWAVHAAACTVQRRGAQRAMPTRDEVEALTRTRS